MPIFMYSAKTNIGKNVKGTMEANDRSTVMNMLKEKGYFPLKIEEQSLLQKDINISFGSGVKMNDLAIFCRQFAVIINAGVSVLSCLDILRQQTENKKLKAVLHKVYESVQKGSSLSDSMRGHKVFPSILLNMIRAGEVSGNLDVAMERMAAHFEKEHKIGSKVKAAMTYPMIVATIATIVVAILVTFVVPSFIGMFSSMKMELPTLTKVLLKTSSIVRAYWYFIIAGIAAVSFIFRLYTATEAGSYQLDAVKLKIPVFGPLAIKISASRFTRTLSTLLASGLSMITALEVVARVVDNRVVSKGIEDAKEQVVRGISLSKPIAELKLFPPMVVHMLKIGEDTGSMELMLEKTAAFYDDEVDSAVTRLTTLMEPLILVIMAIVIGFIVLAVVQPMFQMFSGVENL